MSQRSLEDPNAGPSVTATPTASQRKPTAPVSSGTSGVGGPPSLYGPASNASGLGPGDLESVASKLKDPTAGWYLFGDRPIRLYQSYLLSYSIFLEFNPDQTSRTKYIPRWSYARRLIFTNEIWSSPNI